MEQVAVMQNIFYNRKITKIFDLKGSLRGRFAAHIQTAKDESRPDTPSHASDTSSLRRKASDGPDDKKDDHSVLSDEASTSGPGTLLDGDFLEFTRGRPMPMTDRAKAVFQMSILNVSCHTMLAIVYDVHLTHTSTSGHALPFDHQRT